MNKLTLHLKDIFQEIIKDVFDTEIDINDIIFEFPPKKELWDYAFPCFWLSKLLKKWPSQIGQEIIEFINKNNKKYNIFSNLEVAWPYLNIKIDKWFLASFFIQNHSDLLNIEDKNNNTKTIVIDYIWANVWKPLHIWHMCTPNQWQVFVNLFKKFGYNVISDSHIWDWGIIFGKLIYAYKNLGWDEEKLKENAVEHLFELYVKISSEVEKEKEIDSDLEQKIRDEFKLLSEWNTNSIKLWQKFTRYSIDSMNKQLDRLHIKPDYNIWESFYEWLWLPKMENYPDLTYNMKQIVEELIKKWIAIKNEDGSVWVVFADELKIPSCILQKRDWTHGYLASDLACIKYRIQNWNPEKIIYFVDVRQQLHLKQAFTISKMAGWIYNCQPEINSEWQCTELFHAYNWFISLKDWAMSTRKWRIIKLEALLDEAQDRAKKIIVEKRQDFTDQELTEISTTVSIWAIKYGYLSKSRTADVIFDWDEFMNFEGNSWPYIQYAYVRARNILENAKYDNVKIIKEWQNFDFDEEVDLAKELFNYKEVLFETWETYFPHILCNYAYNLTKKFNSFYNKVHILSEENENKKQLKLLLVDMFSQILKDSFSILWIDMPEKM